MKSTMILSEIQNKFRSGLSGYYPDNEIRQIFFLVSEYMLNYSKIDTFLKTGEPISAEITEKFDQVLLRLQNWEPVQYILGSTWFYGLKFEVDQRVLIPRQETEELVDWLLKTEGNKPVDLLDIGCGSGCISVSLAVNAPQIKVSACDISPDALKVALKNAEINKADIRFFEFDMLSNYASLPGKFHVIVSNPPYVRPQEKLLMQRNVLDYEPGMAIFAPEHDPLLYYKRIALLARKYLHDGGSLYLEINEHFPREMVKMLKNTGLYSVELKNDLNGKARMIRGRK
jgi:release factor glutamine methyltransferase